jgi:hypothetical protein
MGQIFYADKLTPELCRKHPEALFVFGDNVVKQGNDGQACIRGEPNAVGIPMKWTPRMSQQAFFSDDDKKAENAMLIAFKPVIDALEEGKNVFLPTDMPGDAPFKLEEKAPRLFALLHKMLDSLDAAYGGEIYIET